MIRNIIFDMGNVLIYYDPDAFLDRINLIDPEDRALLKREIYLSLEWSMMDRGSLTDDERPILPVAGMEELVRELKHNGYSLYLLSNASYRQHVYWPEIPASELFDGTLISADVHLVKPQPEIYKLLCSRFSLKEEECVFIDDSTANAEGAVFSGMKAIVFHDDVKELRRKLHGFGVHCEI